MRRPVSVPTRSCRRARARACATSTVRRRRSTTAPSRMRAPEYDRGLLLLIAALALPADVIAQSQSPPAVTVKRPGESAPAQKSADGRYGIQVLVATLNVHTDPTPGST